MKADKLKGLVNPFWASVALLVIIVTKAALMAAGFEYANVLYALIPAPLVVLAHSGGMLLVMGASGVGVLADSFAMSLAMGERLAFGAPTAVGPLEKFLVMCTGGAAVCLISAWFSSAFSEEARRAEDYLKKLYLQRKENASVLSDAKSRVKRVRQDVDMYSSLVLLLEEAAEKIYSHLNPEELIETFFLVLRKCLSAETGAIYFIDEPDSEIGDPARYGREHNYTLHASFGYGPSLPYDQPEVIPASDPLIQYVAQSARAIALYDSAPGGEPMDPQLAAIAPRSGLRAVMIAALLEQNKVSGIATINSFREGAAPDEKRDASLLSMLSNITSIAFTNARLFMKIQDMADRDPLTRLFNRGYFYNGLGRELSRCHLQDASSCVLLFDIDHFKAVNDTYGHQAGDAVLVSFAETCKGLIRDCDILARYGGEEFVVLLPGLSLEEGRRAAERIRRAVAGREFSFEDLTLNVTVSCGVAAFPDNAPDVPSLTKAADLALYEAKEGGRNQVVAAGGPASETFDVGAQTPTSAGAETRNPDGDVPSLQRTDHKEEQGG